VGVKSGFNAPGKDGAELSLREVVESKMTKRAPREPEQIRQNCAAKFRPVMRRLPLSFLGYLLGEDWGEPRIEDMMISDEGVLARIEGQMTHTLIFCCRKCLIRQVVCLGKAVRLDGDEMGYLLAAIARIKRVE
jgi:hypothetical protein